MKRKQTDTDNDLQKPTYTNHQEPTQHDTHQPNPQPTPQTAPRTQTTIYQDSTEFFFRSSLGFLPFDEEQKNAVCKENAPCIFSPFSVYF